MRSIPEVLSYALLACRHQERLAAVKESTTADGAEPAKALAVASRLAAASLGTAVRLALAGAAIIVAFLVFGSPASAADASQASDPRSPASSAVLPTHSQSSISKAAAPTRSAPAALAAVSARQPAPSRATPSGLVPALLAELDTTASRVPATVAPVADSVFGRPNVITNVATGVPRDVVSPTLNLAKALTSSASTLTNELTTTAQGLVRPAGLSPAAATAHAVLGDVLGAEPTRATLTPSPPPSTPTSSAPGPAVPRSTVPEAAQATAHSAPALPEPVGSASRTVSPAAAPAAHSGSQAFGARSAPMRSLVSSGAAPTGGPAYEPPNASSSGAPVSGAHDESVSGSASGHGAPADLPSSLISTHASSRGAFGGSWPLPASRGSKPGHSPD